MDAEERLTKLRKDLANYHELYAVRKRDLERQHYLVAVCEALIKDTQEAIEWLESGGWDAVTSDY